MGTSLGYLGLNEFDAWSAPRRLGEPHIRNSVKKVHIDFLESGVDIITTNTYDSQFEAVGGEQTYKRIQWVLDNIDLANEAIDEHLWKLPTKCKSDRPLLAMSVGSFATVITGRAETANREQNSDDDCRRREQSSTGIPAQPGSRPGFGDFVPVPVPAGISFFAGIFTK